MGFGHTSLSGVRRGFMPPQLKTNKKNYNVNFLEFEQNDFSIVSNSGLIQTSH